MEICEDQTQEGASDSQIKKADQVLGGRRSSQLLMPSGAARDDMMRGGLEGRLMFAAPSELLVAQPVSSATQRLLGAFSTSARGMRAETVGGELVRRGRRLGRHHRLLQVRCIT